MHPPALRLSIRRRFSAGATLHRTDWSPERNRATYGVCANPRGHGHDYRLTVTVEGPLDLETGLVVDYARLAALVDERVIRAVDHKHLNHDVDFLQGTAPTTENLLVRFWDRLAPALPAGLRLVTLDLAEGEDCASSYRGPDA
jgi:6-pyruvoyltetrahydropterin/6-carboxytetrahydropterin synthase